MPERVSGSINARTFSVPDTEDAVILSIFTEMGLLRAPNCGGSQIFIDTRHK
ncbi:hypothetical protein D9M68_907030 [compost metagenome]